MTTQYLKLPLPKLMIDNSNAPHSESKVNVENAREKLNEAAPELLEALKDALAALESYQMYSSSMSENGLGHNPMVNRGFSPEYRIAYIQNIIQKATL